ncbi:MAG: FHA domain-containing protein [Kofleriaceae bacterium]|nr:FHA domain-containing protein [Kofleriaceae bacterium]
MLPEVRFLLPDKQVVAVGPGAVIGRAHSAEVRIDDGRVSEVHAYVSLRASQLVLFALRGRVRCDQRDVPRLELRAGQQLELAAGVTLDVLDVALPESVLALEAQSVARQVLFGVTSIMTSPAPHLAAGHVAGAAALVWSDGRSWRAQIEGQRARTLRGGDVLVVGGTKFRAVDVPRGGAEARETAPGSTTGRLRLISLFDSVQVWREPATEPCVLSGQSARLVAELLALGGPVRWEALAGALWDDGSDTATLRHRLDIALARTRRLLGSAGIRRDLITSHRNGWIELLLYPGDIADDRA